MTDDDLDTPVFPTKPPQRRARPGVRYSATNDPWELVRRALFALVKIRPGHRRRSVTKLEAYFRGISGKAAKGEGWALREQLYYLDYMEKRAHFGLPFASFDQEAEASKLELARYRALMLTTRGKVFLQTRSEFKRRYTECYGDLTGFDDITLLDADLDEARRELERAARRRRQERPGQPYETGYGKPPLRTRWPKGVSGNPSGKPKAAGDVWDALHDIMLEPFAYTSNGIAGQAPAFSLSCEQALANGFQGDRSACVQIRRLIDTLWRKGMLRPPEPVPRPRKPSECNQSAQEEDAYHSGILAIQAFEELSRLYEASYGPIEAFEPEFIREARAVVEKEQAVMAQLTEIIRQVQAEHVEREALGVEPDRDASPAFKAKPARATKSSNSGRLSSKRSKPEALDQHLISLLAAQPTSASVAKTQAPSRCASPETAKAKGAGKAKPAAIRIIRKDRPQ